MSQAQLNAADRAIAPLGPPRFEDGSPMVIAGMNGRFTSKTLHEIPTLWEHFAPHIGSIPGQVGAIVYGVCHNARWDVDGFDYLAGVEVADAANLPVDWTPLRLPGQRYAVFAHRGHATTLSATVRAIWNQWLPRSGHTPADEPIGAASFFERYGEGFDPQTGGGDIEVWVPIKA